MPSTKTRVATSANDIEVSVRPGKVAKMLTEAHGKEIIDMLTNFVGALEGQPEWKYERAVLTLGREIVALHEHVEGNLFDGVNSVTCIAVPRTTTCSLKDVLGMLKDDDCDMSDKILEHMVNLFWKADAQVLMDSAFSVGQSMTEYCAKKRGDGALFPTTSLAS